MERWMGKVALVTGASSGIGREIAKALVESGMKVVAIARRLDNLKALETELSKNESAHIKGIVCDVRKEEDILNAFTQIHNTWGGVSIVINNAGVYCDSEIPDGKTEDWKNLVETNVIGPSICSREGLKSMETHGIHDGHIIFINSISGHKQLSHTECAYYSATKHALKSLTGFLRSKLAKEESKIRISSVSPGLVYTRLTENIPGIEKAPHLLVNDVCDAVLYVISAPERVNVSEMIIQATGDPW